jgi:dipeptidyl aminopeptidase/acylaminoacyl peptidase
MRLPVVPLCAASLLLLACDRREPAQRIVTRPAPVAESITEVAPEPFREQLIAPVDEHPFSVRDLLALDRVGDPQVSPDGTQILFTLRKTDLEKNRGRKDLWVVGRDGKPPIQLTTHPENEDAPRWLPDGRKFLFLQKHAGSVQVWRGSLDGDTPAVLTSFPVDVANYSISPDGRLLAFAADVFPDCDASKILACTAERLAPQREGPQLRPALHPPVRPPLGHLEGRPPQPPLRLAARRQPRPHRPQLRPRRRRPLQALRRHRRVHLQPRRQADRLLRPRGRQDRALVDQLRPLRRPRRRLFRPRQPHQGQPRLGHPPRLLPRRQDPRLSRHDPPRLRGRPLPHPWSAPGPKDRPRSSRPTGTAPPTSSLFSADGQLLYLTAQQLGQTPLFAVDLAGGPPRAVVSDGAASQLRRAGDRVVFLHNTLHAPDEIASVDLSGGDLRMHTAVNAAKLKAARMGEALPLEFVGANKDIVRGMVVKPVDFDPAKKYPVAFLIHGGPQGSFGNRWSFRWNPQTYAGAGYAVVMIDFHGSTGYGQAFTDAIQDDWGGKPLQDLKAGLAAALSQQDWLDPTRVCALGASYGGFMVNWIASQWPDAFQCLVNHDGVFDNRMMYYATEELWFPEWEHKGPYWEQQARHELHNPVNHVDQWRLPMLVIHGSLDYRIPDSQGLATFTALQRRGIPSQLLVFPDENHWVLKPANSLLWHDSVLTWLDTWLRPRG